MLKHDDHRFNEEVDDMPDISDISRPREWTMELVELVLQVYCNYCWENVLSESERNELGEMEIYDCVYSILIPNCM